jgi:hypothetical protein
MSTWSKIKASFTTSSGLALLMLGAGTHPLDSYGQTAGNGNAASILAQLSQAVSKGIVIHNVQMSGSATWHAGSLEDSGTVNLTTSTGGSSQMTLVFAASGQRTESQTGAGGSATCQWSGSDSVAHAISLNNCWKANLWFLPAISLQPSLLPSELGVIDLGTGSVGSTGDEYRHIQSQLVLSSIPSAMTTDIMQQSTADLGLDPTTLLPAVLAYSVRPDNGALVSIAIEIRYSDYRTVNGVQIPFLIQRYVNGSLQLEIQINSAQVS